MARADPSGICPMCKKLADINYRPFCSRRCADLDLAKWLNGSYTTPSEEPVDPYSDED
ncbi:MAG: DNA gyrase inhibitor YacG [Rhodobacteraceae bacterium]|nr:DNA gyrase inhibitor YacG [Paracoccaceae bacterium]